MEIFSIIMGGSLETGLRDSLFLFSVFFYSFVSRVTCCSLSAALCSKLMAASYHGVVAEAGFPLS
jgi:hypothetical protein